MRKAILTVVATAALAATVAVEAQAIPAVPKNVGQDEAGNLLVVRDGCGWRRHYNKRLGRCVWDWRG